MNAKRTRSELNSQMNTASVVIWAIIVCVAAAAIFTQHERPALPGNTYCAATTMTGVQERGLQAQLAVMSTTPVDLGIGVSVMEMNRSIAQDQGIRNSSGGYVVSVKAGSPADRAGIRPGDVVNRINGR